MKTVSIALSLILLAGCAPTMTTLPVTATAEERQRGEACHTRALGEMERGPSVLSGAKNFAVTEIGLAIAVVVTVTAPIWYPIAKAKKDQRLYDNAYFRCMNPAIYEALPSPTAEK